MLAVRSGRPNDLLDPPLTQKVDRSPAPKAPVSGHHEMHTHPRIIYLKGGQYLTDARQQAGLADLERRKHEALADLEPKDLISLTLLADPLRGNAKVRGDLRP